MNHHDLRLFAVIGIIGGIVLSTALTLLSLVLWWWLGILIAAVAGWYSVDLADRLAHSYTDWRQACDRHDEEAL